MHFDVATHYEGFTEAMIDAILRAANEVAGEQLRLYWLEEDLTSA
jgi:hypothetical protein